MARSAVALSSVCLVPLSDRDEGLDGVREEYRAVDSVRLDELEALRSDPCRLAGPTQHRQHVGERDVRPQNGRRIACLLGELESSPEMPDALVCAADVGEVPAEVRERSELHRVRADLAGERERLLARRKRFVEAPRKHQPERERRESLGAFR